MPALEMDEWRVREVVRHMTEPTLFPASFSGNMEKVRCGECNKGFKDV